MKNPFITLCILLACCVNSFAQAESSHHLLSPVSFSVSYHTNWYGSNEFQDFNNFVSANGISLVPSDVNDFILYPFFPNATYGLAQSNLSFLLGFKGRKGFEKNSWNEWQIGVTWNSNILQVFELHRNEVITGDTFFSGIDTLTIDTSVYESYYYSQDADALLLNVSRIYFTNPDHRFFFYAGLGAEIGSSINNIIDAFHTKHESLTINQDGYQIQYGSISDFDQESEQIKADPVLFFRPYIPLGAGFRFAKKQTLLQHFSLTVRTSFGIEMGKGNETSFTKMFWSLGGGLTYTI